MLHKTSFISFIRTCIDKIRGKKHKTPLEEFEEKFLKKRGNLPQTYLYSNRKYFIVRRR